MKLVIDPMPTLRNEATDKINARYLNLIRADLVKRTVHQRKAEQARAALAGNVEPTFAAEADLRGLKVEEFSNLVLNKAKADDGYNEIELMRQRALLAVEAAATPAEIEAILANKP